MAAIAPPVEPDPANELADFEKEQGDWYDTRMLVGSRGAICTVSATAASPGTRTTARRIDGKSERIGRETSSLNVSASFLTADGTLWNAFFGELKRLEKGRWVTVAPLSDKKDPVELASLNTNGPPWLLIDRHLDNLWRLEHGANGDKPQLTVVDLQEGGTTLRIADAITWSDGALLLATDAGLRAYHSPRKSSPGSTFPSPRHPRLCLSRTGAAAFGSEVATASGWPSREKRPSKPSIVYRGSGETRFSLWHRTRSTMTASSRPSVRGESCWFGPVRSLDLGRHSSRLASGLCCSIAVLW